MSDNDGNGNGGNGGVTGNDGANVDGNPRAGIRVASARRGSPVTIAPTGIGHNPNAGDTGGNDTVDSGGGPRKRGRPAGSRNKRSSASETTLDLSGLAAAITSAHIVLSLVTKNDKWALDETEATQLAQAVQNATRHHDIAMAQKTIDYVNLAVVAGMVYGTRIVAIRRDSAAKKAQQAPTSDDAAMAHIARPNVAQFPGG